MIVVNAVAAPITFVTSGQYDTFAITTVVCAPRATCTLVDAVSGTDECGGVKSTGNRASLHFAPSSVDVESL